MVDVDEVVGEKGSGEIDVLRGRCYRKIGGGYRDYRTSRALQCVRLGSWSHQNARFVTSAKYDDDRGIREVVCLLAIASRPGRCCYRKGS
jgi:hypothetical protein